MSENYPYCLLDTIGDFNAKLRQWYSQGTNTYERISVENIASQFGLRQIITERTYISESPSSNQPNLVTYQPNLVVDSETHFSLCTSLQSKSMDWFLYDRDLRHERVRKSSEYSQWLHSLRINSMLWQRSTMV